MQPSRTATVCEVDRARKRAASRKRAQNLGYRINRWRLITRNDPLDSHPLMCLAQRSLALRPAHSRRHLYVASYTEGFSHFVTSMTAPVASGLSVRRVGLAPTGKRRLLTAHANSGHCPRACPFSVVASPDPIRTERVQERTLGQCAPTWRMTVQCQFAGDRRRGHPHDRAQPAASL